MEPKRGLEDIQGRVDELNDKRFSDERQMLSRADETERLDLMSEHQQRSEAAARHIQTSIAKASANVMEQKRDEEARNSPHDYMPDDLPSMSGYKAFKARKAQNDPKLQDEIGKSAMIFFAAKPAVFHYSRADNDEGYLSEYGVKLENPDLAIETGRAMQEMREAGYYGDDDNLLFDARRAVIGKHLQNEQDKRAAADREHEDRVRAIADRISRFVPRRRRSR